MINWTSIRDVCWWIEKTFSNLFRFLFCKIFSYKPWKKPHFVSRSRHLWLTTLLSSTPLVWLSLFSFFFIQFNLLLNGLSLQHLNDSRSGFFLSFCYFRVDPQGHPASTGPLPSLVMLLYVRTMIQINNRQLRAEARIGFFQTSQGWRTKKSLTLKSKANQAALLPHCPGAGGSHETKCVSVFFRNATVLQSPCKSTHRHDIAVVRREY